VKVSVLLITFNEAQTLPRCLEALRWCDDIVIVDSGSTDGTIEIGLASGARLLHHGFSDFSSQRNYGLEHGKFLNEWILHLDADEVVTAQFVEKLNTLVPDEHTDAYFVPSKMILFGKWLKYSSLYPVYQARLGHVSRLKFRQEGHGQREDLPQERMGYFDEPYLHYSFSHGMSSWLRKHVRYADDEAVQIFASRKERDFRWGDLLSRDRLRRRRGLKILSQQLYPLARPWVRFFYIFLLRRGCLDGKWGLIYCFMLSLYEGMIALRLIELDMENEKK